MPDLTDYDIVTAMKTFGGSFVSHLGRLWCLADDRNQARLKAAFPEYWAEYARLAELSQKRAAEAQR